MKKSTVITVSGWAFPENCIARLTGPDASYVPPSVKALKHAVSTAAAPVVLIGWSMGAMAAIEAAVELKDRILSLVVISGTARFCTDADHPHGVLRDGLDSMIDGIYKKPRWTLEAFYRKSFFPAGMEPQMIEFLIKGSMATSQDTLGSGLKYMREYDQREKAAGLDIPTLIIHGKKDRIIPAGAAEYLTRIIPGSRIKLIDDAGHAAPFTHADEISAAIAGFLEMFS